MRGSSTADRGVSHIVFALMLAALAAACGPAVTPENGRKSSTASLVRGGELVVSVRTEPKSFNWYLEREATTEVVTFLTQARLVRVSRATQDIEPWLADSWTRSADGLQYTLKLRRNITFADGQPFTADDVLFSFAAAYDAKGGGPMLGDTLMVAGKPLAVTAPDPSTVVITFPVFYAPGLRLLDNLPMLPRHKLEGALKAGTFASMWGLSSPVSEITGLGPFVLSEFRPGQRLVFTRNERYFRKDADGNQLPYLERVVMEIVPDQSAQMLRLEAGQSDMMADEVRPEDYARMRRAADTGRIQLFDLGISLVPDSFWINLRPGAFGNDPRASWLQREELRHAISFAVDRQAFADTVFLGAGEPVFGPVTPANRKWYSPDIARTPYDPARAKELLARVGLIDRNGDGTIEDPRGAPARFTLSIQKGRTSLERGATVIREDLRKIGLTVDLVPFEGIALTQRLGTGQGYEAAYFQLGITDPDPALNQDLWLSSGPFHVWHLGQKKPATDWERRIDDLMAELTAAPSAIEAKKAFDEVQRIFAEHLPMLNFAAPKVFAAASARLANLTPAVLRPQFLWSPDTIAIRQ